MTARTGEGSNRSNDGRQLLGTTAAYQIIQTQIARETLSSK